MIFSEFRLNNKYAFSFNKIFKNLISLVVILVVFNLFFLIVDKIGGLGTGLLNFVNFLNYIFLVIIFSFSINAVIFFIKAQEEEKKIKNSDIDNFEKYLKNFLIFIMTLWILKELESILGYIDVKNFIISSLVVSSIIFYFYDRFSISPSKKEISLSNNKENLDSRENNFKENSFKVESFEEDTEKFTFIKDLSLKNLKNYPYLTNMFIKLASTKSDKEALKTIDSFITMLNKTLLNKEFDLTSFNNKIDMLTILFYRFIHVGKKFLPMLILAYFVYLYQETNNSEAKEYLRSRLKSLVNHKNINTPKRIVEILLSWQYIHKLSGKPVPSIKRLPKFFKKLLRNTLENYSPLTLKKFKMLNCSIKLADLIKILHPKPKNNISAVLYGGIIQNSKISKLKEDEYLPNILKKDSLLQEKIKILPINALLRNLKNINFENDSICNAIEKRLKDVVSNIHKIERFVNIFDFYMPFLVVSKEDVSQILKYIKNQKISSIIKENFNIEKFSEYLVKKLAIDIITESLDFGSLSLDKIEKISIAIDYLLLAEKFIRLSMTSPDLKLYSFMNHEHYLKVKNKDKIKTILDEALHLYFENNKVNKSINIIIKLTKKDLDFSALAKAVSFLTSKYKNYQIIIINDKIEVYTEQYNELIGNLKPINKYLKTLGFFVELSRFLPNDPKPTDIEISTFYEHLCNYISNSKGNFVVLDGFRTLYRYYISEIEEYSKKINKKVIIYDYQGMWKGYYEMGNFTILSANIDKFVFDIIDSLI